MLFPSAEALLQEQQSPDTWSIRFAPILRKIRIFRISDMAHRFTLSAASVGDQLFIFDRVFCSENSSAMTALIRATDSSPKTPTDALNVAKLYLALSYYQAEDPASFVATRSDKPRSKNDGAGPRTFSDLIGVAHSPQVIREARGYLVDLYTRKLDTGGAAIHWKIELTSSQLDEEMASTEKWAPGDKPAGNKSIKFQVGIMADGFTEDGARTDIEQWLASDGPAVSRVHYYYPSFEKAEGRMSDTLQNALAVLQNTPWTGAGGQSTGKEALVIRINQDQKSLYASRLFLNQDSLVELSCACLRNVSAGPSINDVRSQDSGQP